MGALTDLRVIDLSSNVAGPLCTKLFADFGADVIKVESPLGDDQARRLGPFSDDEENPETSGMFLYLNSNKRGITLNLGSQQGVSLCRELISAADVVVESFRPGAMEGMGLGFHDLEDLRPGIILTSITPFGQTGPWRDHQATDLVEYAASGLSYVNGLEGREPLKSPGSESYYHAGLSAFAGTMTAICSRDRSGNGEHIDVSILEAATSIFGPQLLASQYSGSPPRRRSLNGPAGLYPCKDGYVSLNVRHEPTWQFMWLFFGEPEKADDPRFATQEDRRRRSKELEELLLPYLAQYTREELFHGLSPLRILVGMALDVTDVVNDPHLQERGFFTQSDHPVAGEVDLPGAPFKMSLTPWQLKSPSPILGQHNQEVFAGILGHSPEEIERWHEQGVV
jgi:crotonobetainyl-CoA:carnitine CoA-transferase CaiB-like acyl-CoA transferase